MLLIILNLNISALNWEMKIITRYWSHLFLWQHK